MKTDEANFLSRWSRRKAQARQADEPPVAAVPEVVPKVPDALPDALPDAVPASTAMPTPERNAPPDASAPTTEALPTMADVALLDRDSDYSRFVARGLDENVKNAAMKKLFSDPHFNVMDGLDTYIDDYGKPDPIPLAMLRRMNQSAALGLFADEEDGTADKVQDRGSDDSRNDNDNDSSDSDSDREKDNESGQAGKEAEPPPPSPAEATPSGPHLTHDDDADLQLQPDHAAGRPGPGQGTGP